MQVKICGLRTAADVDSINKLHPDYAGFVFAPGRHQVKLEQVQTLRAQLAPGSQPVPRGQWQARRADRAAPGHCDRA